MGRMTGRPARHCSLRNNGGAGVARVGPTGPAQVSRPDERRGERSRAGKRGVCLFSRGSPALNPGYQHSNPTFLFERAVFPPKLHGEATFGFASL